MSGWLFLRNFNKQKINNISQRNYINSLVVLTIKIAKATDRTVFAHQANIINTDLFCVIKKNRCSHAPNYLAGYLNTKHYCRMDNKARNNFQLIRQNNVNEAG
ncbi:hypothetical protein J4869_001172 [Escherichia coli]|uniref:hypothetical protein n=1 Tax=Escherichia coli TaxID=562 RepID=UPI00114019A5|nr:hypothetical protein [Escherichia coli]EEZ5398625.1 hypothetical protein [Escherichia coli]EFF2426601.1 hypothetical protein [Escherichia coli]EFI7012486.1 hypothetical protein [Escherichia coli]EHH4640173.1 hypothetical protein [Escherichia coli]MBF5218837.1 hypothetical protein [Escherichia coli]